MNIAYIVGTFPALTETFILREIQGMRQRGADIHVFAIRRAADGQIDRSLCSPEVFEATSYCRPHRILRDAWAHFVMAVTHPVKYCVTLLMFLRLFWWIEPDRFVRLIYHFGCGVCIARQVREKKIEHIHAHFASAADIGVAVSSLTGVPFSFAAHASNDLFVKPVLLEQKVARAQFVVADSEYARKYLDSVTGYRFSSKLYCVFNGVDECENGNDAPVIRHVEPGTVNVVSVGSLNAAKGHRTLIRACGRLRERGVSVNCTIIGGGPDRGSLVRLIQELNLAQTVRLSGPISLSDVYKELASADIFALLSEISTNGYRDGFPTVMLEAMLMKLPVVGTYISAIPELVASGHNGYLVPERDVESAAAVLFALAMDPLKRREMGEAGRRRVLERFNSREQLNRLYDLIAGPQNGVDRCNLPDAVGVAYE